MVELWWMKIGKFILSNLIKRCLLYCWATRFGILQENQDHLILLGNKRRQERGGVANNPRRIATTRMDSAGLGRAPSSLVDLRVFDDNLTSSTLDLSSTSTMNLGLGIACSLAPRPSVIASTFSDNESSPCHSQRSNEDSGARWLDPCLELDQGPASLDKMPGERTLVEAVGSRKRFRVVQGGKVTKDLAKWEEVEDDRLLVAEKIVGEKRRKKQKLRSEPRDGVDFDFEPESGEGMVSWFFSLLRWEVFSFCYWWVDFTEVFFFLQPRLSGGQLPWDEEEEQRSGEEEQVWDLGDLELHDLVDLVDLLNLVNILDLFDLEDEEEQVFYLGDLNFMILSLLMI